MKLTAFEQQMQQRTGLLIGQPALETLNRAHVLIAGLGGVGGHCLEAIVRAGVGQVTIVDFDGVDVSNINRQILATSQQIGQLKTDLAQARVAAINPETRVYKKPVRLDLEQIKSLIDAIPDLTAVVDCIDQFEPNCQLLAYAHQNKIPVFSSMGAGRRLDPTRIKVADISQTTHCRLAKKIRSQLGLLGVSEGITAVFSTETPINPVEKSSTVGSISYMPALFGYTLAGVTIRSIIGQ